jgi:hypothetical protein
MNDIIENVENKKISVTLKSAKVGNFNCLFSANLNFYTGLQSFDLIVKNTLTKDVVSTDTYKYFSDDEHEEKDEFTARVAVAFDELVRKVENDILIANFNALLKDHKELRQINYDSCTHHESMELLLNALVRNPSAGQNFINELQKMIDTSR